MDGYKNIYSPFTPFICFIRMQAETKIDFMNIPFFLGSKSHADSWQILNICVVDKFSTGDKF